MESSALWAALVRVTPHPMISESARDKNSRATLGSGYGVAHGAVIRSGEYSATMSAARRDAMMIERSAPARRAASPLKARHPAYWSLPPAMMTRP